MDGVVVDEVDARGAVVRLAICLVVGVGDVGVVACRGSWLDVGLGSSVFLGMTRGLSCWLCNGRVCSILRVVVA